MRASMGMSDVREFRPTDFEAIDKHLAEKEAIERSKRGLLMYEEVTREEASSSDRCSKEQIEDLTSSSVNDVRKLLTARVLSGQIT